MAGACLPDDVKNATTGLSAEPHPLKQAPPDRFRRLLCHSLAFARPEAEWDPRAFVDEESWIATASSPMV